MAYPLLPATRYAGKRALLRGLGSPPVSKLDVFFSPASRRPDIPLTLTLRALYRSYYHPTAVDEIDLVETITTERCGYNTFTPKTGGIDHKPNASADSLQQERKLQDPRYPTTSPLARKILKEYWGHQSFRLEQEAVISRLIDGGSAVAVFPTGAGKSLLYQIAALGFDQRDEELGKPEKCGITLVVSPLIALIKDQTQDLQAKGIPAAAIVSSDSRASVAKVYKKILGNQLKLLYCSPERLNSETFVEILRHTNIRMIAVDEAHCVFEWGHSFRPDYLKVARFVKEIGAERVLCVTATATPEVATSICSAFGVPHDGLFRSSSYRPNLQLLAKFFHCMEDKIKYLISFLRENSGATIVYVTTRAQTEYFANKLVDNGFEALAYHAGMDPFTRETVQDRFMNEENITIVATIAFGLGINKPDIRNVVHCGLPRNIEAYSQEIGRAGRDGKPSKCMTLMAPVDFLIRNRITLSQLSNESDIRHFLKELCKQNREAKAGDIISVSLLAQSKDFSIEPDSLNILYSKLELQFGLLRGLGPKYSNYTYKSTRRLASKIKNDKCEIVQSIIEHSTGESSLKSIDIDYVSNLLDVKRDTIILKLKGWDEDGLIDLRCTGYIARYRILQAFPQTEEAIEELIDGTYKQMKLHMEEDLARNKQVSKLICGAACFSHTLAGHFGDVDAVPEEGCRNCQYCLTGEAVNMKKAPRKTKRQLPVDRERILVALEECSERSDPELLAKVSHGVTGPKITRVGHRPENNVLGSMVV